MVDPISDMLTRIRNAQAISNETVLVPFSNLKLNLAKILEKEGLIGKVNVQGRKINKIIEIKLSYKDGEPAINSIKRISKQGQRIYIKKDEIKPIRQGYGLSIISTSKGLMTNIEAKKKRLGGEVICEIY